MKKLTSILSLIILVVLAIWQYFTDPTKAKHQSSSPVIEQAKQTKAPEPKLEPQFETKQTDIEKSAVKKIIKRSSKLTALFSLKDITS